MNLKKIIALFGVTLSLAVAYGNESAVTVSKAAASDYTLGRNFGAADSYIHNDDGTIVNKFEGWMGNFLLLDTPLTNGNYEISITFTGTKATVASDERILVGIIPWFYDDASYTQVYLDWNGAVGAWATNSVSQMTFAGEFNGAGVSVWKDGYVNSVFHSEWLSHWPGGVETPLVGQLTNQYTLRVQKIRSEVGDADIFYAYLDGITEGAVKFWAAKEPVDFELTGIKPKVGLFSQNDTITFTDFTVKHLPTANESAFVNRLAEITCDDISTAEKAIAIKNEITDSYNALRTEEKSGLKANTIEGQSAEDRMNYFLKICELRIAGTTEAQSALNSLLSSKQESLPIIFVVGVTGLALVAFYYAKKRKEVKQ